MLRKAIAAKTPMGIRAKAQVDKGKLVGDDIVIGIIKENLFKPACSKGFVLDGFPRNIEQARALNELLEEQNVKLDSVLEMTIPEDKLMDRVCGRRIHPKSGRTYLYSRILLFQLCHKIVRASRVLYSRTQDTVTHCF